MSLTFRARALGTLIAALALIGTAVALAVYRRHAVASAWLSRQARIYDVGLGL
jgi:hypothetical protein